MPKCENCGTECGDKRFCSRSCACSYSAKAGTGLETVAECVQCGKKITVKKRADLKKVKCKECKKKRKQTNYRICSVCGQRRSDPSKHTQYCNKRLPFFKKLSKFGLDLSRLGTPEIFAEIDKAKNEIMRLYKNRTLAGIKNEYFLDDANPCANLNKVLRYLELDVRYSGNFLENKSDKEKEVVDFLSSFNINIFTNTKVHDVNVDIYLPEHNLAIEFDGIYWHSDKFVDKNYHLNKTETLSRHNIQLIHIFEDEWDIKQNIVKNILAAQLGVMRPLCGARRLRLDTVDAKTAKTFYERYHLQGSCPLTNTHNMGAFHEDRLVACMSFFPPRNFIGKNKTKFELIRFCTDGQIYPGIASRLFVNSIRRFGLNKVISYCDRRYFSGRSYLQMGFKFKGITQPNYWYIVGGRRVHRFKYCKSRLVKDGYDPTKTEKEIMSKYLKIWDCGNLVFEFDRDEA